MLFTWDKDKALSNFRKHGVAFEEAETVFLDEEALLISDPEHSSVEERFVMLGMSLRAKVLVVCHCYKDDDETIRIISARKANKREQGTYLERYR